MAVIVGVVVMVAGLLLLLLDRRGLIRVGDRAPDFSGSLDSGDFISLSQYVGQENIVLFFYPKDFTPGCTAQVCAFRDMFGQIRGLDAVILGVSHDTTTSHSEFKKRHHLPFALISDPHGEIAGAYGALRLGGRLPFMKRVTYVIDRSGVIRAVAHHELAIRRHITAVVQTLKSLRGEKRDRKA